MKDSILEFYVNKFCFLDDMDGIDISFIPSILRRKTSKLDKVALSTMNSVYSNDIQNIVFSSQFGEVERLLKIIDQYTVDKETSPAVFSASVHNYPVGFFLFNLKNTIPYTALSGGVNSISTGLISSVCSDYDHILYCYADVNDDKISSLAINLSKTKSESSVKYRLSIKNNDKTDEFSEYIKFFKKEINFLETPLFTIERAE